MKIKCYNCKHEMEFDSSDLEKQIAIKFLNEVERRVKEYDTTKDINTNRE